MLIKRFYVHPAFTRQHLDTFRRLGEIGIENLLDIDAEICFHVVFSTNQELKSDDLNKIRWFLCKNIDGLSKLNDQSIFLDGKRRENKEIVLEFGPRLSFTTPFSTNAVSALHSCGLSDIKRVEKSIRYFLKFSTLPSLFEIEKISNVLHDRMTECLYKEPPKTFDLQKIPSDFFEIDVLVRGKEAIEDANKKFGLALDPFDIDLYWDIFAKKAKRNPTNVELFDLAQSNSEHSRHWFFKGRLVLDGVENESSLFQMVMDTQKYSNSNNVIKFCDNSSGINGDSAKLLRPEDPTVPSSFQTQESLRHIIYTAETHNFPTGVCPFPGAATGTGGRIRDVQAAGRGGHVVAAVAGYSFGNLNIPCYIQPWERSDWCYPSNFARPLDICIQASNGASDYGNKFGEPVICGFARSFGQPVSYDDDDGDFQERIEYIKPIMFSGGIGTIDDAMLQKCPPKKGMLVVKMGGPAYRIGVGGGSASSVEVQGDKNRCESLDFGAVQRGDAEMEQKLNRVIRSCLEIENNPILSIHDQGAGGNGNVLKELVEGAGAVISCDKFDLGDPTLSVLELWGAEYQESNAILIQSEDKDKLSKMCRREKCPVSFVGEVSDDNKIVLRDFNENLADGDRRRHPVDLDLDWVLGSVPKKTFQLTSSQQKTKKLQLPSDFSIRNALERVLRLPSVASKRYLTNKVDRSVTGLIAQQQCVGPLHTPLADVAVTALSYFDTVGSAVAVGEQPIKILADPQAGARMTVGEALTNLVFAPISDLKDVKFSANWMWPAKLPGEGAKLLSACQSMCTLMSQLGVAVDGGKDSLSMAARVDDGRSEIVKSPGTLVLSAYARCTDVTKVVTPDLKCRKGAGGTLFYVCFGDATMKGHRLGGSALAQCYLQIGSDAEVSDLFDSNIFAAGFNATQKLIKSGCIQSGHDVSDGGLICCCFEMAFGGNCGIKLNFPFDMESDATVLFGEGLGIVVEVAANDEQYVTKVYQACNVPCHRIGRSVPVYGPDAQIEISIGDRPILNDRMIYWKDIWEETSYRLEKFQCNVSCVEDEREFLQNFKLPPCQWSCEPKIGRDLKLLEGKGTPTVAVLREEGSNGDREMAAAFIKAGFNVWDVCMQDLLDEKITIDRFDGLAFVGGFSYADVFGAAKGWASAIVFNEKIKRQFDSFRENPSKFSFGVCNGCQLMALLGWVGYTNEDEYGKGTAVILDRNRSERFESRFCYVKIEDNNSIMLKNMIGNVLGVWVAHGEGKFVFENAERLEKVLDANLAPIRFIDDSRSPTDMYPMNPNGSPHGIAALCSSDGRHLAVMPHPERCFISWQWPYWPKNKEKPSDFRSPWMNLFENAFDWCLNL